MEFTVAEGLRTLKLDLVLTLALAAIFLFVGGAVQRNVGLFSRASIPAAAIGGLLFASLALALRRAGLGVALDTSLRAPLQTAFFTTIGFGATLRLLRAGGARMILFFVIASLLAVAQNLAGIGVAAALHAPPALGIICGALTLTGGPATGLAFAGLFEQKGVAGAGALIIASATFGIFVSSLVGNPAATWLIRRREPRRGGRRGRAARRGARRGRAAVLGRRLDGRARRRRGRGRRGRRGRGAARARHGARDDAGRAAAQPPLHPRRDGPGRAARPRADARPRRAARLHRRDDRRGRPA